ncbi:DNA polymerase III subunit beta [bacterium]|nr:DNA polymerase III subunit beta [bacterium]
MELQIKQVDLSKALSFIQSIVERKTTMPILANVLLRAEEGGTLTLSATDLETTAVVEVPANISRSGTTTISAKVFHEVVRELPDRDVKIHLTEGERLQVSSGRSKFSIVGVHAEEFPSLPGISIIPTCEMQGQQLLEMIHKTVYAVSSDETRFNLNGVCFELAGDAAKGGSNALLRLVATDGHRLSLIQRAVEGLDFEGGPIVPTKGLLEVRKLLDDIADRHVGVALSDGFFVVDTGKAKVSMRLIDGEFPDYHQVLPKEEGIAISLPGKAFADALKRAMLMVTDKGKCIKLDFSTGRLRFSSSSPELGESHEELEIEYRGEPLSIGFNARYLLDFTGSLPEEANFVMVVSGELGPAKLHEESDDSYFGIVMPMRLG